MSMTVVWPGLDLVVQTVPGAFSGPHITVTIQVITVGNEPFLNAARNQVLHSVQRCGVGKMCHKISHERGSKPSTVVSLRVGTHMMPTTPLIYVTILAHQETVSNITPS